MRIFTLVLRFVSHIFSSLWNVGWWREHIWNPLVSNVIQGRAISVHFYITTYILSGGISVYYRNWVLFTLPPLFALSLFILNGAKHIFHKLKANSLYESLENPQVDYNLKIWITIWKWRATNSQENLQPSLGASALKCQPIHRGTKQRIPLQINFI